MNELRSVVKGHLLTTAEAADYLRVHPNTIKRWTVAGDIKAIRLNKRGDLRYRRVDLDAFLDARVTS